MDLPLGRGVPTSAWGIQTQPFCELDWLRIASVAQWGGPDQCHELGYMVAVKIWHYELALVCCGYFTVYCNDKAASRQRHLLDIVKLNRRGRQSVAAVYVRLFVGLKRLVGLGRLV